LQRVHLNAGETKHITFTLDSRQLSEVDAKGIRSVQPGSYTLSLGGAQPEDPLASTPPQKATFNIEGHEDLPH
jgi:beta-glucosidase